MYNLELFTSLLPYLIPLAVIQLVLMITALVSIFRRTTYKMGNRVVWVIIVIVVNTIGPILYFILGRGEE